jgi:hypothetical protein
MTVPTYYELNNRIALHTYLSEGLRTLVGVRTQDLTSNLESVALKVVSLKGALNYGSCLFLGPIKNLQLEWPNKSSPQLSKACLTPTRPGVDLMNQFRPYVIYGLIRVIDCFITLHCFLVPLKPIMFSIIVGKFYTCSLGVNVFPKV